MSIWPNVHFGECPFWKIGFRGNVYSAKCTFWQVSILENVYSEKCSFGQMYILARVHSGKCTFGEMFIRPSVFRGNVLSGRCFLGRCSGSMSIPPHMVSSFMFLINLTVIILLLSNSFSSSLETRGGVEDTRLEAKAKDTKKIRGQGQGQPFQGQTLSRPRTEMLEAKDQGHKRKCSPKKKRSSQKLF